MSGYSAKPPVPDSNRASVGMHVFDFTTNRIGTIPKDTPLIKSWLVQWADGTESVADNADLRVIGEVEA